MPSKMIVGLKGIKNGWSQMLTDKDGQQDIHIDCTLLLKQMQQKPLWIKI